MPFPSGNQQFDSYGSRKPSIPPPYTPNDPLCTGQSAQYPEMQEVRDYGIQPGSYEAAQAQRQTNQYGSYGNYGASGSNQIPVYNYGANNYAGTYAPNVPYNSYPPSYATNPPPVDMGGKTSAQYGQMPYPPAAGYGQQPTQTYQGQNFVVTGPRLYQPSVQSSDSTTSTERLRRPKGDHLEKNRRGKMEFVPASSRDDDDDGVSTSTRRSKKGSKTTKFAMWATT